MNSRIVTAIGIIWLLEIVLSRSGLNLFLPTIFVGYATASSLEYWPHRLLGLSGFALLIATLGSSAQLQIIYVLVAAFTSALLENQSRISRTLAVLSILLLFEPLIQSANFTSIALLILITRFVLGFGMNILIVRIYASKKI